MEHAPWPDLPAPWLALLASGAPRTPLAWLEALDGRLAKIWAHQAQQQVPPGTRTVLWEAPQGPMVMARHWRVGEVTDLHDHGQVAGAEWVLAGALWVHDHDPEPPHALRTLRELRSGERLALPATTVHRVHNASGATALTLHVYAGAVHGRTYGAGRDGP